MALGSGSGVWTHMKTQLATSGTQTFGYFGARGPAENYTKALHVVEGTFSELRVELTVAPGSGKSRTFELFKNGVATGLTVTISGTDKEGSDLINSVSTGLITAELPGPPVVPAVVPYFEFKSTVSGTPAASRVRMAMLFTPTNHDYEHPFSGYTGGVKLSSISTEQIPLGGDCDEPISGTTGAGLWLPNAGTIRAFAVRLNTQTGGGGQFDPAATRRFQLFKNGSVIAGGTINFTKGGGAGQVKVAFPDVAYADNDNLYVQSTKVIGTPAASYVSIAVSLSSNSDEFTVPYCGAANLPTGVATKYDNIVGGIPEFDSNIQNRRSMGMNWRGIKLRTHVSQLPDAGKNWSITFPPSLTVNYFSSSSQDLTKTGSLDMHAFEDKVIVVTPGGVDAAIKSKLSGALLMTPIPVVTGDGGMMGSHF